MKIVIPGIPVPQARMRHAKRGNFVTTYDPNAKEKESIRTILRCPAHREPSFQQFHHPRISFLFHMPIPSGIAKRDISLYHSGKLKHEKKPDTDNLIKLYLDCLDGIIIQGDQKVSLGSCVKVYNSDPKTIVWVNETEPTLQPWELDLTFLDASEREIQCFCEQDYPHGSCSLGNQALGLSVRKKIPGCDIDALGTLASVRSLLE